MKKHYIILCILFAVFTANAQTITFTDPDLRTQLLAASSTSSIAKNAAGANVAVDTNGDSQIQVSEALVIYQLVISYTAITNLGGIENFTNLRKFNCSGVPIASLDARVFVNLTDLICCNGQLTSIIASGMTNLLNIKCWNNQLTSITVTGCTNLVELSCMQNQLTNLNLNGLLHLDDLGCYTNQLTSIDLSGCSSLTYIRAYGNMLTNLDVSECSILNSLECYSNNIMSLDLSQNPLLDYVNCQSNLISSLNLQGCVSLTYLQASANQLITLNASETKLSSIYVNNNQLISLFVKNGKFESPFYIMNNPNLSYICCDESQLASIQGLVVTYGIPNCTVNTYCSFVPGGNYYTVQGNSRLDYNSNGCDENDLYFPFMKFDIVSGSVTSNLFANSSGFYSISLPQGTYSITPRIENPSYFNISPPSVLVTVPLAADTLQQNFCLSLNGSHRDLECWIIPLTASRPGFDSRYKIVYKNKGNQIMSGTLTFSFDDDYMDFVSATPAPENQSYSLLTWNYMNLIPFETREIEVMLNMNTPLENLPLNIGGIIKFESTIFPLATDETQTDNSHRIQQVVVGSFDPNDKNCLEGNVVDVETVGEYVHYMIRFENTGTYAAENVVVKDVIDTAKFDIATLVPLSASHSFISRIANTNRVEFIFENINLPFDDANNDGYVAFKIKTKPTLVLGDTFSNSASIYFDYNFPIITNTYSTTIAALGTQDFEFGTYFSIYPNPAKQVLNLEIKTEIEVKSINIYNMLGQIVIAVTNAENVSTIDMSDLSTGTYFIKLNTDKGSANTKFIKN